MKIGTKIMQIKKMMTLENLTEQSRSLFFDSVLAIVGYLLIYTNLRYPTQMSYKPQNICYKNVHNTMI